MIESARDRLAAARLADDAERAARRRARSRRRRRRGSARPASGTTCAGSRPASSSAIELTAPRAVLHRDVPLDRAHQHRRGRRVCSASSSSPCSTAIRVEVGVAAVAEEVRADARRDAAPHLRRVRLARAREHELVEADVGLDAAQQVVRRAPPSPISQTSFASSAKSASRHPLERLREAEPLEREADRDQDLVHLLVGDAEHDGAAVRDTRRRGPRARAGAAPRAPGRGSCSARARSGPRSAARRRRARRPRSPGAARRAPARGGGCAASAARPRDGRSVDGRCSDRRRLGLLHQRHC